MSGGTGGGTSSGMRGGTGGPAGGGPPSPLDAGGDRSSAGFGANARGVLVQTDRGLEPRILRLGLTNFDYAQVLSGVQEGERVVLLSIAEVQAKRTQDQSRIRARVGSGMPGTPPAGGPPPGGGGGR